MRKTIAIDFDGVIHNYSKGWQDGSIYDGPKYGAIESINELMKDYNVFIFSTRKPAQIKKWMIKHSNYLLYISQTDFMDQYYPMLQFDRKLIENEYVRNDILQYRVETINWLSRKTFWNKEGVIGITRKKLAAHIYIDDRGYHFKDWSQLENIKKLIR